MTTLSSLSQTFRPLKCAPGVEWSVAEDGRVSVFVKKGRKRDAYHVFPLSSDFGGACFRWHNLGSGKVYDLRLGVDGSTCSCPGFCWTAGCKHVHSTLELLESGDLPAAPGWADVA